MIRSIVQIFLELWWAECHDPFPGEIIAVTNHPVSKEPSSIQSDTALLHLLMSSHWSPERDQHSPLLSSIDCDKDVPRLSLLQVEQTHGHQLLLLNLALKTSHHFDCSPQDTLMSLMLLNGNDINWYKTLHETHLNGKEMTGKRDKYMIKVTCSNGRCLS